VEAFWKEIYKDNENVERILSIEVVALDVPAVYNARLLMRSQTKYFFAKWSNQLCDTTLPYRPWKRNCPVTIQYEEIGSDSMSALLSRIDSAYHPLSLKSIPRAFGRSAPGGFAFIEAWSHSNHNLVFINDISPRTAERPMDMVNLYKRLFGTPLEELEGLKHTAPIPWEELLKEDTTPDTAKK
jgi:hypothetical protein